MTGKPETDPGVDEFIRQETQWQAEFEALRQFALACGLSESVKWRQPCFSFEGSNVAIIGGFKDYCVLSFFKGALLQDPLGILAIPGENTQSARMMRFTGMAQISRLEAEIKEYIHKAIELEKAGLKVEFKETVEYNVPEEFQMMLDEIPELKEAFEALTPGRQRGYLLYFSQPKQSKTRTARVERMMDRIFEGKGLNDR